jgi:transposase
VLGGEHVSTPRGRGILSALWVLLVARHSVVAERTRVLNQLQALNATAPVTLRERVGDGTGKQLERRVTSIRARASADIEERAVFAVMRDLAARSRALAADARRYEQQLTDLVRSLDRTLLDKPGVRPISAAKLLACDPARFKHEAAFARCNGTAPLPASSGKTVRHRLNRGGDRQVNNTIHTIAVIRAKHQPETRAYLDRRISEGKTKREAMRALKRHISRDLSKRLADVPLTS